MPSSQAGLAQPLENIIWLARVPDFEGRQKDERSLPFPMCISPGSWRKAAPHLSSCCPFFLLAFTSATTTTNSLAVRVVQGGAGAAWIRFTATAAGASGGKQLWNKRCWGELCPAYSCLTSGPTRRVGEWCSFWCGLRISCYLYVTMISMYDLLLFGRKAHI